MTVMLHCNTSEKCVKDKNPIKCNLCHTKVYLNRALTRK